jgi:hypothetical protein
LTLNRPNLIFLALKISAKPACGALPEPPT